MNCVALMVLLATGQTVGEPLVTEAKPLDPPQAATRFATHPGADVQLAAAEPDVIDPVSAAFDAHGRLWVVEMRDYPTGPKEGAEPNGRIVILADPDGDGRYTLQTLFADKLLFPTGVLPWKGGAIVTLAGQIAYFADADGDGKSDSKEVWFEGFAEQNTQLRASHPRLGADGRVYVAGGLRGGSVVARDPRWTTPDPISLSGRDFAFDIRGGWCGSVVGNSQFGLHVSEQGHRFVCDNRHPCRQVIFDESVLNQNPWLTMNDAVRDVAKSDVDSAVASLTGGWTTSNLHAGQFTAACGVTLRTDAEGRIEDLLVCEPTANIVQRQTVDRAGVVYDATRVVTSHQEKGDIEWLASDDVWFRPVDILVGPTGATFIVDMYRAVIEHPQWMPAELKTRPDMWWGIDRGRIWRIEESHRDQVAWRPLDAEAASTDPVTTVLTGLRSPSSTQRQFAIRHYYALENVEAFRDAFRDLLSDPASADIADIVIQMAAARGLFDEPLQEAARTHQRGDAVRAYLRTTKTENVPTTYLVQLLTNGTAPQMFEALIAGGRIVDNQVIDAVVAQADTIAASTVLRQAATSGELAFCEAVMLGALATTSDDGDGLLPLLRTLAQRVGHASSDETITAVLAALPSVSLSGQEQIVEALAEGLARRRVDPSEKLRSLDSAEHPVLPAILANARERLADPRRADTRAVRLAGYYGDARDRERLLALLDDVTLAPLHSASLEMLSRGDRASAAQRIVDNLAGYDASTRGRAFGLVLSDAAATERFLTLLADGSFPRGLLSVQQQAQLRRHKNKDLAKRAADILGKISGDRQAVIDRYRPYIEEGGDPKKGRVIFEKQCSACHRIDTVGTNVGPDISDSRTQTPIALLTAVLDPNAAIDAAYLRSSVLTDDGRQLEGLLEEQTAERISLRQSDGTRVVLDPQEVIAIRKTALSLMPEGFEQQLDPQTLADLIAYIKNWRYLD